MSTVFTNVVLSPYFTDFEISLVIFNKNQGAYSKKYGSF